MYPAKPTIWILIVPSSVRECALDALRDSTSTPMDYVPKWILSAKHSILNSVNVYPALMVTSLTMDAASRMFKLSVILTAHNSKTLSV